MEHSLKSPAMLASKTSISLEYTIMNLHCANCAAKIEATIKALPEVEEAVLNFSVGKLSICVRDDNDITNKLNAIAEEIEPGVIFVEDIEEDRSDTASNTNSSIPWNIILGAVLFIIGQIFHYNDSFWSLPILIIAYMILGRDIIYRALRNILRGQIFDENFLMSVATLGAFGIGEYPEAVGVMLFYRIGEYFEERATNSSRREIMSMRTLKPTIVHKLYNDTVIDIPVKDIAVDDCILVKVGDRVPLDGIVIDGVAYVDNSAITGESKPVTIARGEEIFSGGINLTEAIVIKVTKNVADSMLTKIIESVEHAAATKPRMDKFIHRFAKIYTPIVVAIASIVAIVPSLITGDWYYWIYTALTFLVISCPCALVLSVPLAFFAGIGLGAKQGILFKGGMALESLSKIRAVVMDKTGTLTEGKFKVLDIQTVDNISEYELIRLAASAERVSNHPIATSIVDYATNKQCSLIPVISSREIAGQGLISEVVEGIIICGNSKLFASQNIAIPLEYQNLPVIHCGFNNRYIGYIRVGDEIKEDAAQSLHDLRKLDLQLAMLTGDNRQTAVEVGSQLGIKRIFAQLLPQGKLACLHELRKQLGAVFFIGDGINDAPILAGSDVGAAMGSGADIAIESADVVFMNTHVQSVVRAVNIARTTLRIAWQNVIIAIGIKVLIMLMGLAGYSSMWIAVFADTGVVIICILNSMRILYKKLI